MLVDPDECAVDKDIFEIGIVAERPENAFPNALLGPPPEASIRRKPLAERFRQIAPRRARPRNPKNRFDKKSVVTTTAAGVTDFTRQLWGNPLPLRVVQHQSNQGWPPFFSLESTFYRFGNPVCKQALEGAVSTLPHPVSSSHVKLIAEAILRSAHEGERDPKTLQTMALLELQISPRK